MALDQEALRRHLHETDERLQDVGLALAAPGESKRIVCVKDVIEPRVKRESDGRDEADYCIAKNVAVVTCGPIVGYQEGIIDMSGPGADLSPYSELSIVALDLKFSDEINRHEHEEAVRNLGFAAAEYIARCCLGETPDRVEQMPWRKLSEQNELPRIAYVYLVLSQGLLHDTYVFGRNAREDLPIACDPTRLLGNAIISGNCVSACDKNTTYNHQNNPILQDLVEGHGRRWNFVGVVITNSLTRLAEKEASAQRSVDLVREMNADGAIVSKEGFGNPDSDLMMLLRGLEQAGVKSVAVTDEFAGIEGDSQSLADSVPEADALASTGNANERVELPAMATTIGPLPDVARLAGGYPHSLREDGSMVVELQAIVGATNELGCGKLSCREV